MLPVNQKQWLEDYDRIERGIHFLAENYQRQPSLEEVAGAVGLSEYHFQRLFTRWAGISPKRFLQYLTKEHAKTLLAQSTDLLNATYASGLSSPGRLHDLFVACEAVTPGEYKRHGAGMTIRYAFQPTPFGECLIARTERGICGLTFIGPGGRRPAFAALQSRWMRSRLVEDGPGLRPFVEQIFSFRVGKGGAPIPLLLKGTNFQLKVWEALLQIPAGQVACYEDIAASIGVPQGSRAVGGAVKANPIAYLIPCHRVIRKIGDFGEYQAGKARKLALLGWEMARES